MLTVQLDTISHLITSDQGEHCSYNITVKSFGLAYLPYFDEKVYSQIRHSKSSEVKNQRGLSV